MLISLAVIMFYSLGFVLSAQDIRVHQHLPSVFMIGPIINKNMRSLSIKNLTNGDAWDSKDFDVFLMSVPGLKPFIILRETENENIDTYDDQEDMFKTEEPQIDLNKIQFFSKSYHIGRIHLERMNTLRSLHRIKPK